MSDDFDNFDYKTGAFRNQPPCEKCQDTRRYKRQVFDPTAQKRFVIAECLTCGDQTKDEISDE